MSSLVSGTLPQPSRRHDPIRALLRAGDNDEAIVQLCAIVVSHPDDLVAKELLFDAFFQKREWAPALALVEELVRRQPDTPALQKALIATLVEHEALRGDDRAGRCTTSNATARISPSSTRSRSRISTPARSTRRSATGSARSSCATPRPAAIRRPAP